MRSALPKVLHPLAGRALIDHVIDTAIAVTGRPPIVVVGPGRGDVVAAIGDRAELRRATRAARDRRRAAIGPRPPPRRRRGAGHVRRRPPGAGRDARPAHRPPPPQPRRRHAADGDAGQPARAGSRVPRPRDRARGAHHRGARPAARRDGATRGRRRVYVFDGARLWPALARIGNDNAQGEYYLPDVLPLLGGHVEAMLLADAAEALGINDRRQLADAEAVLRARVLDRLMADGVTVEDPATTYVDATRAGRARLRDPADVAAARRRPCSARAARSGPWRSSSTSSPATG